MTAGLRSLGFVLALTAMLLRGLLPAGWMPSADGSATIIICTGHGPMAPDPHRGHSLPERANQFCPFAAAVHHSPPLASTEVTAPGATGLRPAQFASAQRVPPQRFRAIHSPRAPPVLA